MLALAGYPLGLEFTVLEPAEACSAGHLVSWIQAAYDDPEALSALAESADLITYEFENVPQAAVSLLASRRPLFPPPAALGIAQDRLHEKLFFHSHGVPTSPFAEVNTHAQLVEAVQRLGLPAILKTRRLGYDGKGQVRLNEGADLEAAWHDIGGVPSVLEALVLFEKEVSLLAARGRSGETVYYPLVENVHRKGNLRLTLAPGADVEASLQHSAEAYLARVLEALDYVGVLAVEFFVYKGGLLANEMAPRVHNSGHWTIEGAVTSQFENHLRAICGLPLGSPAPTGYAAMVNLIGELPRTSLVLALPGVHLHLYAKTQRVSRKLGHITLVAADAAGRDLQLAHLMKIVHGPS